MAGSQLQGSAGHPSPSFELEQTDAYSKFLLYSKSEILFVLRTLIQKGALITVYFDQGNSFLLTTLLAIDPDKGDLRFDPGGDEEMNRRVSHAGKLIFTTLIDKVKVQFSLQGLGSGMHEGRPVFVGKLPEVLLRLQRREYFRLATPVSQPLKCMVATRREDGSAILVETPVLDISGGGIGLMLHQEQTPLFPIGSFLADCKITLPEEGMLVASLSVRNAFSVTTKTGHHYTRMGCEFVELPGARLTMIQRYITRIERERKARLSGIA